jgi:hypothetical protein
MNTVMTRKATLLTTPPAMAPTFGLLAFLGAEFVGSTVFGIHYVDAQAPQLYGVWAHIWPAGQSGHDGALAGGTLDAAAEGCAEGILNIYKQLSVCESAMYGED